MEEGEDGMEKNTQKEASVVEGAIIMRVIIDAQGDVENALIIAKDNGLLKRRIPTIKNLLRARRVATNFRNGKLYISLPGKHTLVQVAGAAYDVAAETGGSVVIIDQAGKHIPAPLTVFANFVNT